MWVAITKIAVNTAGVHTVHQCQLHYLLSVPAQFVYARISNFNTRGMSQRIRGYELQSYVVLLKVVFGPSVGTF